MRICTWDTESTDLTASWGRMLCSSRLEVSPHKKFKPVTFRYDDPAYINKKDPLDQTKFLQALVKDLEQFNLVLTWYGKLHDLKFLNAALAKHNLPAYKPQLHLDLCLQCRQWFRLGRNSLDHVQKYFNLPESKTPLDATVWQRAAMGDRPSLNAVVKHCEHDVIVTGQAYWHILPHVTTLHR